MQKKKILVVDDDPDIVELIRLRLEHNDYGVIIAENGWEALGAFRAKRSDLIILDVMLPKENGYQVSRMIREDEKLRKDSEAIPIIIITGRDVSDSPEREDYFLEISQADALLYKPFELEQLVAKVEELLA